MVPQASLGCIVQPDWIARQPGLAEGGDISALGGCCPYETTGLVSRSFGIEVNRSRLDGTGSAERISPEGVEGQFSYQVSPDARWAIATYQNAVTPDRISLISLPAHRETRLLEDNGELKARYDALGLNGKEFFRIDIGEVELDAWMIKPVDFDPNKKYPLFMFQYSGPGSQQVANRWHGSRDYWHQLLASRGYIIACVDGRGTGLKGRDFKKVTQLELGKYEVEDQIELCDFIKTITKSVRDSVEQWVGKRKKVDIF